MRHKKDKHGGGGGGGGVNLSIIITPMLDMAFQILAFFIMTYRPSDLEGHIDGTLLPPSKPAVAGNKAPSLEKDIPVPEIMDVADTLHLMVRSVAKGNVEGDRVEGMPSRFELRKPEDVGGMGQMLGGAPQNWDDAKKTLQRELERIQKDSPLSKTGIKLEGDPELRHRFIMEVYDVCKQAGYKDIHFVAPVGIR